VRRRARENSSHETKYANQACQCSKSNWEISKIAIKILSIVMVERAEHFISSFDSALYGLRNDILMMSSPTDRMLQTAFEALLKRDRELCDLVAG